MSEDLFKLSHEQCKQIYERGYTYVEINGHIRKIFKKDLLFKVSELEEFEKKHNIETKKD